ncbi:MAG: sigma-70 family RNA polymerase sigma factor [Candidatus Latescibacteria bacterium]|nr:sigma-70 family RNA polymerase sigma factor [Candidatus Latescibacterota bacterium]
MDSEAELVRRCQAGDETAFAPLMRPYEYALAALIRYRIGHPQQAEDILQDTLVLAWGRIGTLKEADKIGAWLMQIGRNLCRDYFKAAQRRERPTEAGELARALDGGQVADQQRQEQRDEAARALEELGQPQQQVARLHYLEGFSIAEIAARGQWPQGTVKRHLFQARQQMRQKMDITACGRRSNMQTKKGKTVQQGQPFPLERPPIAIEEMEIEPFAVDCPELRWWLVVPRLGEEALQARYSAPDWQLGEVNRMRAVRPAEVHGLEGVEVDVEQWDGEDGQWRTAGWSMCARENEEEIQYLATIWRRDGRVSINTYLNQGYNGAWGCMARRIEDKGRYVRQQDGSWKQAHSGDNLDASGAGVYRVQIGGNNFTCLRVLQLEGAIDDQEAPIDEAYITPQGRTVLIRDYVHDDLDDIEVDRSGALVIDGVHRYHWTDRVTGVGLGL